MTNTAQPKIVIADYLKHLLIRTPLQQPAQKLQSLSNIRQKIWQPEMEEIFLESERIEIVLERIIKPDDNCIDIGCHLGSVLNTILRHAPDGNHLAFEAVPYKAEWLKQKFPEVKVTECALSDEPGEVTFYQNIDQSGFSGLRPHKQGSDRLLSYNVRSECLDNLVDLQQPINFIKVDVEGAEIAVLKGADKILREHQPTILFECTQSGLSCFEMSREEVFHFFQEYGYAVFLPKDFIARAEPLSLSQFDRAMQDPPLAYNFVALPKTLLNDRL